MLAYIKKYLSKHGYPPSRPEICLAFGFKSPNAAQDHLTRLANKGAIKVTPHVARGIRVISA